MNNINLLKEYLESEQYSEAIDLITDIEENNGSDNPFIRTLKGGEGL